MDTPDLNPDSDFWTDTETNTVLLNPRLPNASKLQRSLESAAGEAHLRGHVIFSTSGSTGIPKFACLSKSALLASATAVNEHLKGTREDRWFSALPVFHVGGFSIWARARLLGCSVTAMEGRWGPVSFCEQISKSGATLTAMVPTQVHDLVDRRCTCPRPLRAVLVGGGALSAVLRDRALELGWPTVETFGMTETASQVATESTKGIGSSRSALQVLPIWSVRCSKEGNLELRGTALFSGYLERQLSGDGFTFARPFSADGWFSTSDRVELSVGSEGVDLHPICRTDEIVKVLGENVDVSAVQGMINDYASGVVIVTLPDSRAENQLVAVVERGAGEPESIERSLQRYNRVAPPPERLNRLAIVRNIPTTELGKVAKHQLISELSPKDNFRTLK